MADASGGTAATADGVASPCIGVCKLDTVSGLCQGCLRSANEIGQWRDADGRLRRRILERIVERRVAGFVTAVPATDSNR